MPWDTIGQAAVAITAAAGAGVAVLGFAQQLVTVGGRIRRSVRRAWERRRRERRTRA
jgi:hypothetical protein